MKILEKLRIKESRCLVACSDARSSPAQERRKAWRSAGVYKRATPSVFVSIRPF